VVAVQVGEDLGDVGAEEPQQRQLGAFHDGDRRAALAGCGGHLQPDPAGADHDEVGAVDERRRDPVAVGQGPQRQNPVQVGAGDVQRSRCRTGGQQQRVVADALTVGQFHLPGGPVDGGHPDAGP
jgi:hypothetical protein